MTHGPEGGLGHDAAQRRALTANRADRIANHGPELGEAIDDMIFYDPNALGRKSIRQRFANAFAETIGKKTDPERLRTAALIMAELMDAMFTKNTR